MASEPTWRASWVRHVESDSPPSGNRPRVTISGTRYYMVESLANGQVDGFCVGAPWNSVAVDLGIGFILHFVCEILPRAAEKVLAVRSRWADEHPQTPLRLVCAPCRAAAFLEDTTHPREVT